jgi:DNA-binding response OmpR family regulator
MSRQARILVVDDNHSVVKLLELLLQREGYVVLTAFDGMDGLQKAGQEKPDLIILDVVMPGIEGYEVCRHLQADPNTANIPVIFLTVKGDVRGVISLNRKRIVGERVRERMDAYDAGATDFLSKPIVAKEVVDRVRKVLSVGGL